MTSILKVSEIQDPTNSNTALTIDSAGRVFTPERPAFRASGYAGVADTRGSYAIWYFNSVDLNDGSCFNNTTGVFTVPVAGIYQIFSVCGLWSSNSNYVGQALTINDVGIQEAWGTNSYATHKTTAVGGTFKLSVSDEIRFGHQASYEPPSTGSNLYQTASVVFLG